MAYIPWQLDLMYICRNLGQIISIGLYQSLNLRLQQSFKMITHHTVQNEPNKILAKFNVTIDVGKFLLN